MRRIGQLHEQRLGAGLFDRRRCREQLAPPQVEWAHRPGACECAGALVRRREFPWCDAHRQVLLASAAVSSASASSRRGYHAQPLHSGVLTPRMWKSRFADAPMRSGPWGAPPRSAVTLSVVPQPRLRMPAYSTDTSPTQASPTQEFGNMIEVRADANQLLEIGSRPLCFIEASIDHRCSLQVDV